MNRFLKTSVVIMMAVMVFGCGAAREIQIKSESIRSGIFNEIKDGDPIPKGFASMTIKATIKTHAEGYYLGESKGSVHWKDGYPFLFNIDGQAIVWKVDGSKETKPLYDKDGKRSRDPEAGEGMKYVLEKKIKLPGGMHNIFFGLPEEQSFAKLNVNLEQEHEYLLEFRPVYNKKKVPTGISPASIKVTSGVASFLNGISEYDALLNGHSLDTSAD
ncbi:MAG: hypothetical protein WC405_04040 [Syntrophales bacterium]